MLCSEWVPSEWESDKNITIIHIIILPPVWIRREICTDQSKTALNKYMFELWYQRQQEMDFFPGGSIMDYVLMMDLFQLFSSPDVNWWTGVDYCDVFIRLSFWRHPFTAEHPLLRHWCISPNLMKKQTHLHLECLKGEDIFSKCSFLCAMGLPISYKIKRQEV